MSQGGIEKDNGFIDGGSAIIKPDDGDGLP